MLSYNPSHDTGVAGNPYLTESLDYLFLINASRVMTTLSFLQYLANISITRSK